MKLLHTTRDGETKPIAAMSDTHLVNMLNMYFQKAMLIKASRAEATDKFNARLYGVVTISDEKAADIINEIIEHAAPYFLEAYLRGLGGPQEMLRTLFGRTGRLEGFDNLPPLLTSGNNYIEIDYNEFVDPEEGAR